MKEFQKNVIEDYINSYNQFDVEAMIKHLHQDVVFENITNDDVDLRTDGIEAFVAQAEKAKQFFSKRQQTILRWDFQDDNVIIDINYQGVLAIDLPGGAMAGDTLELIGTSAFQFEGDQIIAIKDKS